MTGSIEGAAAIENQSWAGWYDSANPSGFSEKELVDCAPEPNEGCMGGYMDVAMEWIAKNNSGDGLNSEDNYRYYDYTDRCDFQKERVSVVNIDSHTKVEVNGQAMIKAISTGPVSIGIDASDPDFQNYDRGVYSACAHTEERIDHGVLAVGFQLEDGNASGYILVKNSWGASWGMEGYFQIIRGYNKCGLAE